jgi:fluoride exporter
LSKKAKGSDMKVFLIGMAGFIAALTRWSIQTIFNRLNIHFPLGTFIVNVTGCLLLGWFLAHATKYQISENTRVAISVGFIGTYTTFSTYIYDSDVMLSNHSAGKACLNLFGSIILGLAAMRLGTWLAQFT